jgi:hypothetical protein
VWQKSDQKATFSVKKQLNLDENRLKKRRLFLQKKKTIFTIPSHMNILRNEYFIPRKKSTPNSNFPCWYLRDVDHLHVDPICSWAGLTQVSEFALTIM